MGYDELTTYHLKQEREGGREGVLSLYYSDCAVNLHENFISILGDMPTVNEFPTDGNFLNCLLYLSSFEI